MNHNTRQYTWRVIREETYAEEGQKKRQRLGRLAKTALASLLFLFLLYFLHNTFFSNTADDYKEISRKENTDKVPEQEPSGLSDADLREIANTHDFLNSEIKNFPVNYQNKSCEVFTSLDIPLQKLMVKQLERLKKLTRGKPERIAMVVMDAGSGKVLGLAGFDLTEENSNPCFQNNFPAASIFKIITAAAAVEELGYTVNTPLYFNGSKYTLYKRQLKDIKNKYTTKISFKKAFAESVNPVFGKIGQNLFKDNNLQKYSDKFEFNKEIKSELTFEPGKVEITDDPYTLAETGCGFNNTTMISPVFGAMIPSTIINDGRRVAPSIIEKIVDSENNIIYDNKNAELTEIVSSETASVLQSLMQQTIETGTARKTFRGFSRDEILSKLIIGGKTGSIYNREHTIKYDWFTGFAKTKEDAADGLKEKIAISVVVGHGNYIGKRACQYGKMIIKEYFKNI